MRSMVSVSCSVRLSELGMRKPFACAAQSPRASRVSPSRSHFFRYRTMRTTLLYAPGLALLEDLGGVVASVRATLEDVIFVGSNGACFAHAGFPLGHGLQSQVPWDSVTMYPERTGDGGLVHRRFAQSPDGTAEASHLALVRLREASGASLRRVSCCWLGPGAGTD